MWVVKLGGSLHDAASLRPRLAELATMPGPPRIVVPGGGPFADAVRAMQPQLGFDGLAAHRMAILAMQQYGLALQALEPRLALAQTDAELRATRAGVWLPWELAGMSREIEANWDVTSDSLAAWLATRLGARMLILVKSAPIEPGEATSAELADRGMVDPAFPAHARLLDAPIRIVHRDTALTDERHLRVRG